MHEFIRPLMEIFQGYEKAYGRYEVKRRSDSGKMEGRALTIRQDWTERDWQEHLTGKVGLGSIPLRADETTSWGAIDIDVYNLDHQKLEEGINALGLPLIICRSKSGGAHCYCFITQPVPAYLLQNKLKEWASLMGYGGSEIFPKQTSRIDEEDAGNWINLPYQAGEDTLRPAIRNGRQIKVQEFIDYVNEKNITPDELENFEAVSVEDDSDWFEEAPPCLKAMYKLGGIPEGGRNNGMHAVGVYLKKRFPDDWQTKMMKYNELMCPDPLPYNELSTIIKSLERKDYDYQCKQVPIASYCNRSKCLGCKFGVGGGSGSARSVEISHLCKHVGDPIYWVVEIEGGHRLRMETEDLLNQNKFRKHVVEKVNKLPTSLPTPRWERLIAEKLEVADVVESPQDASMAGLFETYMWQYLNKRRAKSRDELLRNTPWQDDDGTIYFTPEGMRHYMHNQGFKQKPNEFWQTIKDLGGESKVLSIEGTKKRVWYITQELEKNNYSETTDDDFEAPF